MTRKHFQLLADRLNGAYPVQGADETETEFQARVGEWGVCVLAVASACKEANPNFDRDRFHAACLKGL